MDFHEAELCSEYFHALSFLIWVWFYWRGGLAIFFFCCFCDSTGGFCFEPTIFSAHLEGSHFLLFAKAAVDKITKLLSHSSLASENIHMERMTALAHRPNLLTVTQLRHWVHVLQLEVMNEATHSRIALGLPFSTFMSAAKNTCQRGKSHPSEFANRQRLHKPLHL